MSWNRIPVLQSMDGVKLGPQLWSCLKSPISTPPLGLAHQVKVRVGGQNDNPVVARDCGMLSWMSDRSQAKERSGEADRESCFRVR